MSMNWLRGLRGEQADKDVSSEPEAAAVERPAVAPAPGDPQEAWVEAVCRASDKQLAGEWATHVDQDALLGEIAIHSRFAEVRLAAVRRITDLAVLKLVAEASRDKDKHVYRHCTEGLKAHRQEDARARRAAELVPAIQALLEITPIAISHLLQIEKDLAAMGEGGEETAECNALLDEARARVLLETQAQIDLRSRLSEAEALRAQIVGSDTADAPQLESWRAQSEEVARNAASGPSWLAALPAARLLAKALEDIDKGLAAFSAANERAFDEAAKQVAQEALAAQEEARKVKAAARAEHASEAAASKAERRKVDQEVIRNHMDALEQHLEEGRTVDAEAVIRQIDESLGAGATAGHVSGQLARRLQRARAQQARLLGWARWGNDQAREHLIEEARALLRGEPDVDERARAVPLLRREWKNLDTHGAASQAVWKRFDRALEKAFKPVAEQRAAEAVVHAAARAAREALCEGWDAWLTENTGAEAGPKPLEAKRDEMIAAWRSAPKSGYRDERQLRKRFDAVLKRIDTPLDAARDAELARREELLVAANALTEEADLGRAMSAAKTLQRRWKDEARPVRLRQGAEQKLWQRFRKACDAVFARRDSEQAAQDAERELREQERSAEREVARALEEKKKEKHAARFATMAEQSAGAAESASEDALKRGHTERASLLLDLEIALELPTPEASHAERRMRMLTRLQDRFKSGTPAQADPEVLVKNWYAIVATPDESQAARITAIVQHLLNRPAPSAPRAAPTQARPSRHTQGRRASRS